MGSKARESRQNPDVDEAAYDGKADQQEDRNPP
jgi:hypothetical protein